MEARKDWLRPVLGVRKIEEELGTDKQAFAGLKMSQYLAFIQLFARVGAIATVVALFLLSVVDIMGAIYLTNAVAVVNYFLTMLLSRFYGKK